MSRPGGVQRLSSFYLTLHNPEIAQTPWATWFLKDLANYTFDCFAQEEASEVYLKANKKNERIMSVLKNNELYLS